MIRSKSWSFRLLCAATAITFLISSSACGKDDPTPPVVDPECVVPTVTSFVDSSEARVVIKDFTFQPASITVRVGQTIRWRHCGPEIDGHTVTSDSPAPRALDSPMLTPNTTYSKAFSAQGSNPYHCTPHPDMRGTIVVVP